MARPLIVAVGDEAKVLFEYVQDPGEFGDCSPKCTWYPTTLGSGLGSHANETTTVVGGDVGVVDVGGDVGVVDVDVDVEMIKSTGMDCGVLVAPVAVTVMVVG